MSLANPNAAIARLLGHMPDRERRALGDFIDTTSLCLSEFAVIPPLGQMRVPAAHHHRSGRHTNGRRPSCRQIATFFRQPIDHRRGSSFAVTTARSINGEVASTDVVGHHNDDIGLLVFRLSDWRRHREKQQADKLRWFHIWSSGWNVGEDCQSSLSLSIWAMTPSLGTSLGAVRISEASPFPCDQRLVPIAETLPVPSNHRGVPAKSNRVSVSASRRSTRDSGRESELLRMGR